MSEAEFENVIRTKFWGESEPFARPAYRLHVDEIEFVNGHPTGLIAEAIEWGNENAPLGMYVDWAYNAHDSIEVVVGRTLSAWFFETN